MERPGDWSSTKGKYINAQGHALNFFLLLDTKTLLLIHYQQTEIFKLYFFLIQNSVGTNKNIYSSLSCILQGSPLLLETAESVNDIHMRAKISQSFLKGLIVLLS